MARLIALIAALALGMASAFALVSCGGGDAELLPGETADQIIKNLDTVETLADEGDCEGARRSAAEVSMQVDELSEVDRELIQALRQGTDRLETVVADCEEQTTTEATTETATQSESDTNEETQTSKEDEGEAKKKKKVEKREEKANEDQREKNAPPTTIPPTTPPGQEEDEDGSAPEAEPPSGGVDPNAPVGAP